METVVDRLHRLVQLNGSVSLSQAANALNLTKKQTEKLALILEKGNLLYVNYFFFKEMELVDNGAKR